VLIAIVSTNSETLWQAISTAAWVWVDIAVLFLLGVGNIASWISIDPKKYSIGEPPEAADRLRTAASGALAAVGFLLPLTVLAVQTRAAGSTPVPHQALADFYLAECWLAASLALGAFVLAITTMRGYSESILEDKYVAITFGFQLIFLLLGVIRFVFAVTSLTSSLLQS
jgi:uncharacterized membrane protein